MNETESFEAILADCRRLLRDLDLQQQAIQVICSAAQRHGMCPSVVSQLRSSGVESHRAHRTTATAVHFSTIDGDLFTRPWILVKELRDPPNPTRTGFVYALEFGKYLKIGSSAQPHHRLAALEAQISNYGDIQLGRMVISPPHPNYRQTEKAVHRLFASRRTKGELFDLTLEEFMTEVQQVPAGLKSSAAGDD